MRSFGNEICGNGLKTKEDLRDLFRDITEPLKKHYSTGAAHLHVGNTSAGYPDEVAEMEGFSRVLWGLAPLAAGGGESDLWDIYVKGIKNGTNPEHEEYWGEINDYDQRMVEMAALGLTLAIASDKVWEPLNQIEKKNLSDWLSQINFHKAYDCNWLLFNVIVNLGLKKAGMNYDKKKMEENLDRIEEFYVGDGWYTDGVGGHADYYVAFAIHYYCLIYAKLMEDEDPKRSKLYKSRAGEFAKDFIYWFSKDGSAIPYGRSLTYRFAQSAFFSALAYAGVDSIPAGVIKGIVLRNLRWWLKQPIFTSDNLLSIGYSYPNLLMAENYNSPGSPYWSFKIFLILSLNDEHPFWTAKEQPLPKLNSVSIQQKPHMVICRNAEGSSVMAFTSGHLSTNWHTHTASKYEKFVYSNIFGFSVPRAEWGLGQGAFDSTLALSEGDNLYRVKRWCTEYKIEENVICSKWKPWVDVEVESWIIAGNPWHVRIHFINTNRKLEAAEGGFAIGIEKKETLKNSYNTFNTGKEAMVKSFCGSSGIVNFYGDRKSELIYADANTNLLHSHTIIPTLTGKLERGEHMLISAVYGDDKSIEQEDFDESKLCIEVDGKEVCILSHDKNKVIFRKSFKR